MDSHLMLDHLLCLVSATRTWDTQKMCFCSKASSKDFGSKTKVKGNLQSGFSLNLPTSAVDGCLRCSSQPAICLRTQVLCDRHFGGINYPVGGVGEITKTLAKGLINHGSNIIYRANVTNIMIENGQAVAVKLSDGREFYAKTIISNATRWDTFESLLKKKVLRPKEEEQSRKAYVKGPSFLFIHLGVKAEVLPPNTDCHHFVLEDDWKYLEDPYGSIFLSIPTVLDSSLAPEGKHILHIFTTSSIEGWEGLSRKDYEMKKELVEGKIISRLEKKLFTRLQSSIVFKETHRRYLAQDSGTYGPMPRSTPKGLLEMPFNTTAIKGLHCVGDSCFPGQGVISVAFSGVLCAHSVAADLGSIFPLLVSALKFPICTLSWNSDGMEISVTFPFARSSMNSAGFIATRGENPMVLK